MTIHRAIIGRIIVGAALGALGGACLPSMNDGERGVQCWTTQARDQSECNIEAIDCLYAAGEDFEDSVRCTNNFTRCSTDVSHDVQQCEYRSGCIAQLSECQLECDRLLDVGQLSNCYFACNLDFERCAPWYEDDCEDDCFETALECGAEATAAFESVRCENERLECVLECY